MSKLILSLDGGGIRGAATTQFLAKLDAKLKKDYEGSIRDYVDFYAGTSTGSIIALALATTQMTMDEINSLYNYDNAKRIFKENRGFLEVDGVNAPKYEAEGKREMLQEKFGNATLGDVKPGTHVLAVTYAVEERKPKILRSTKEEYRELYSHQVADASSAAPTYFPTRELDIPQGSQEDYWLVDGGVIANNPTMCAISGARSEWPQVTLDQMRVLSVGTGFLTRRINGPASRKWGGLQWVTQGHILELLSDERVVAYQAMTLMNPGSYIRVNARLASQPGYPKPGEKAPDDAMDDVSRANIKRLKALGDFWFDQYGEAAAQLVAGDYPGPSLDRIDPATGKPRVVDGSH